MYIQIYKIKYKFNVLTCCRERRIMSEGASE